MTCLHGKIRNLSDADLVHKISTLHSSFTATSIQPSLDIFIMPSSKSKNVYLDALPDHWVGLLLSPSLSLSRSSTFTHLSTSPYPPTSQYVFFGILEPLSVLAGAYYALILPERYNRELIPPAFFPASTLQNSLRQTGALTDASRMALGQLGSCYLLIMLNSALMFNALRKFLRGKDEMVLERLVRYLLVVLGVADCKLPVQVEKG